MRVVIVFVAGVALLSAAVHAIQPLPADDARIRALGSKDEGERTRASRDLVPAGAAAVVPLLVVMDKNDQTAGKMAYETLFKIAQQAAGTDRAADVARELARELKGEHRVRTGRQICRLLSFVGGDESVDTLYRTMNRKELAEMVRWALARIPTPRATQALVGALQITRPEAMVGVINALGEKGDRWAVPSLHACAVRDNPAVRAAALNALASIPDARSFNLLASAVKAKYAGAVAAMLTFGETSVDAGLPQAATHVFKTVADLPSLTVAERCRLLHGWGQRGGQEATDFILSALGDEDPHVRGAASQACAMLPGKEATPAIAKKTAAASGTLKADLLEALGQRNHTMDEGSAKLIVEAVTDKDEAVRIAAIRAIENAGIDSGVPALLKALAGPAGPTRDAAEHAINHMPGKGVTRQIADAVAGASPETRAALILALGYRGGSSTLPVLAQAAKDEDAHVRAAAFKAMGVLEAEAAFDTLLEAFERDPGPDRDAAERAMRQLKGDAVTARMLEAYGEIAPARKPALLRMIGRRRHRGVPRLLSTEASNPNADIRAAAVEGLGRQDDPEVAPVLLAVARRGPANVTEAAMTGYLRAARRAEGNDKAAAGKMYVEALKLAVTDHQKREALNGINRTVDPSQIGLLPLLEPFMNAGNVRGEAARVVARLAMNLPESRKPEAIELLRRVIPLSPGDDTTRKAVKHLRGLGVDVDPARDAGFITTWWLIGPFPNPDNEMFDKAYFPERKVDLKSERKVGDATYAWKQHHTADLRGVVDLEQAVARKDNVGAYGYAEITVDTGQDVVLKIGSDDSVIVWVNGEKVHAWSGSRGVEVDQDQTKAGLEAGTNKVLIKCLNGGQAWAFCVRVTTRDGEPVPFTQKAE